MRPVSDLLPDPPALWTELPPVTRGAIARAAWFVLLAAAIGAALACGRASWQAGRALWLAQAALDAQAVAAARPSSSARPAAPVDAGDFTAELPAVAPTDEQLRFAARLAEEQHVTLSQMQYEVLHADPGNLGRTRVVLQMRGDYRDMKSLLAALLQKFPGLTLERLTVRHATGADEASVELIQHLRPL